MKVKKALSGIVFGTIVLVTLASCDHELVRDNPHDPGSPAYEPWLEVSARHLRAEWVSLEWPDLPGSTEFVIERSRDSEEFSEIVRLDASATSYADSTERAGTYRYRVTRETLSGRTATVTTEPLHLGNWLLAGHRPGQGGVEEFAAPLPDDRILIFRPQSYWDGPAEAVILDPATLTWTSVPSTVLTRIVSVVVLDDGRILALGGHSEMYMYLWDRIGMTIFDPGSLEWTVLPEPPHPPADTYVPLAIQHLGGSAVLVSFQAVGWSDRHFTPGRYTSVLPVSYVFDLETGEYREVHAPDIGGPGSRATVTGMVRATVDKVRAFGSVECADESWETCERATCAWSFDARDEMWTKSCSSDSGAPNLLPVSDYRYLSLADNMTFLVEDGPSPTVRTLAYGSSLPYFLTERGYVIGGNTILVIDRVPFRARRFAGPASPIGTGSTTVLLPDGRLLSTSSSSSNVWVSRRLDQMPEER